MNWPELGVAAGSPAVRQHPQIKIRQATPRKSDKHILRLYADTKIDLPN